MRLGVSKSGHGSNLEAILTASAERHLGAVPIAPRGPSAPRDIGGLP
jgi:hypothetical protein